MAKFNYSSTGSLTTTFKKFFKNAEAMFVRREDAILIALNERILALTPVWEGDLLVNWRWSTRAPLMQHINAVESPGDTGHTGKDIDGRGGMALGTEPRRRANQTRPRQSLMAALKAKTPEDIYLTNASDIAVDAEYGLVPSRLRSRSPNGIVRLAIKEVMGSYR